MNLGNRLGVLATLVFCFGLLAAGNGFAAKPFCGDGKCTGGETVLNCPEDCGAEPPPEEDVCNDGICGPTETAESCPADCGVSQCNDDGVCNAGEDCLGCGDCAGKTGGKPAKRYCCGADTCEASLCGADCGVNVPVCGNGIIEYGEECDWGSDDNCDLDCNLIPVTPAVPLNQFNIGDSIGEGEAANGTIGAANHQAVWSTGYDGGDIVNSLNERFEARDAAGYFENNSLRDAAINQAISGAIMADFADQAQAVVASMGSISPGVADMVTILLGNNDVCASSLSAMTDPALFEQQYRAGLDVLAASPMPDSVNLLVSGIPAIYWLWDAKRTNFWCRAFAWPFVPCENLLDGAADDCASSASAEDPDVIYPGDGSNCVRRKQFHAAIRDVYNPILGDVLAQYQQENKLLNAEYVDIFDVRFYSEHVNSGDCFHPSKAGHALMSGEQWCRSRWGEGDSACSP